jgi:hypothetical protein
MFKHLLHKPSEQRVKEIIINAVRIEQVGDVCRSLAGWKGSLWHHTQVVLWFLGVPHGGLASEAYWHELHFNEAVH